MTYTTPRRVDAEDPATIPTVEELLRADTGTPRPTMFERSVREYPDQDRVDAEAFTSPAVARREEERLWPRVWQMACFEQDVAAAGDFCEYVVGDLSILVVRGTDGRVRAFHNACRHRGTRLKVGAGNAGSLELRCPFHAWAWELDGCLKDIPCRWDFPQVVDDEYGLAEVRCETWKGFVFVNPDPEAVPLAEWLGPDILHQFDAWPLEGRWKAAHVARRVPCNWKLAHQAFMESYHVFRTHPATIRYVADVCAQNDAYGLHGRFVTPTGLPSPHLRESISDQEIVDAMIGDAVADLFGGEDHSDIIPKVPEGATARVVLAQFLRATLGLRLGVDLSGASDSEMLDVVGFPIFPNIVIMVGEELPIVYRFRPDGGDPDASVFEVMVHLPVPPGADRPPAAAVHRLPDGGRFADAPELGGLGKIFDEDMSNLDRIQLGVKSPGFRGPSFSRSQEVLIRQFHHNLARYLG